MSIDNRQELCGDYCKGDCLRFDITKVGQLDTSDWFEKKSSSSAIKKLYGHDRKLWKDAACATIGINPSTEYGKMICAQFDVLMDKTYEKEASILSLESRLKTIEEEHGRMKKALSFPDGIHIRVNFTGCHTEASFHAAIKEAGNDLELQKEQVLSSLSSK